MKTPRGPGFGRHLRSGMQAVVANLRACGSAQAYRCLRWANRPPRPSAQFIIVAAAIVLSFGVGGSIACSPQFGQRDLTEIFDERLGGTTTAFSAGSNAFELSARNLTNEQRRRFEVGDSFFTQNWVTAPASTEARDGLGPTFNAQSCSSCHNRDGRAKPPEHDGDPERGLLLRLSVAGPKGPVPEPRYGDQLQDRAINGVRPEGRIGITYEFMHGSYPDGTPYSLRKPIYAILDPAYGGVSADVMISPRIAQVIVGMGLLEAIADDRILALADPDDTDGDGISGRANMVKDLRRGELVVGRLGWKANQPNVEQQAAAAFHGDIGITTTLFPDENCPVGQTACGRAPDGGAPEAPEDRLQKVAFYVQTLAVPAMRNIDSPVVRKGAGLFVDVGCSSCHTPRHTTGDSHPLAPLRGQVIYPYTDLLLHDMGPGLADGRPDGLASGSEWRTPPLWGIGLVKVVNGHTMFLHDGRARSLEEAVLWHGGEGQASRDRFMHLSLEDRMALLKFLESI